MAVKHMLIEEISPLLPRNLALVTLGKLSKVFSKVNLLYIPPLFNSPEVLSSAYDKAKLFSENFSKNSTLDDSGISMLMHHSGVHAI